MTKRSLFLLCSFLVHANVYVGTVNENVGILIGACKNACSRFIIILLNYS